MMNTITIVLLGGSHTLNGCWSLVQCPWFHLIQSLTEYCIIVRHCYDEAVFFWKPCWWPCYDKQYIVTSLWCMLVTEFGFNSWSTLFMLSSKSASVVLSTVAVLLVVARSSGLTDRPGIEAAKMTHLAVIAGGSYEAERCVAWQRTVSNLNLS